MADNYKRPGVSFNMDDPYERELYEFAKKQDKIFSRYVKRLIDYDRKGLIGIPGAAAPSPGSATPNQTETKQMQEPETEDFSADDLGGVFG